MLVSCVAYEEGRKIADIPVADISEYLHRPNCFVWVALVEPTQEELDEMAREFDLHELAVEDARKGHQRPKIEEYGNEIFAVLHLVEVAGEELHVGEVNIFTGPNFVRTNRSTSSPSASHSLLTSRVLPSAIVISSSQIPRPTRRAETSFGITRPSSSSTPFIAARAASAPSPRTVAT